MRLNLAILVIVSIVSACSGFPHVRISRNEMEKKTMSILEGFYRTYLKDKSREEQEIKIDHLRAAIQDLMKDLVGLRNAVGQCPGEIVDGKCVATEEQLKSKSILEGFYKKYLKDMSAEEQEQEVEELRGAIEIMRINLGRLRTALTHCPLNQSIKNGKCVESQEPVSG